MKKNASISGIQISTLAISLMPRKAESARSLRNLKKNTSNTNKIRRDEAFDRCTFRILIPNDGKKNVFPSLEEVDSFLNIETRNYVIQGKLFFVVHLFDKIHSFFFFFFKKGKL